MKHLKYLSSINASVYMMTSLCGDLPQEFATDCSSRSCDERL